MRPNVQPLVLITVIFLCTFFDATAQKNFQKGYVVTTNGDTLSGLINYRNWEKNPKKVEFTNTLTNVTSSYGLNDIEYFEIVNADAYKKAVVIKDLSPVKADDLDKIPAITTVADTVFLRVLIKSEKLNLYELVDMRPHYFIQQPHGELSELIYRVVPDKSQPGQYYYLYSFRDQLKAFSGNEGRLLKEIDKAQYKGKDLVMVVQKINNENTTVAAGKSSAGFNIITGAGISYNTLDFGGNRDELNSLNFDPATGFSVSAGLDFYSERNLKKLVFRLEFSYSSVKYYGEGMDKDFYGKDELNEYTIKQNNITPEIAILYNFLRFSKNSRLYAGAGIAFNITGYSANTFTTTNIETDKTSIKEDYLDFEKFWATPQVYIGSVINDKIELGLNVKAMGTFGNFSGISMKNNSFAFKVKYHF